jgi:hypothetical protein
MGSSNRRGPIDAALGRADAALETARAEFAELDAPADAADPQEDLIAAIAAFEEEVEATRASLRDDSIRAASEAVGEFRIRAQEFALTLGEIGDRLEDAGVPLGEPTEPVAG